MITNEKAALIIAVMAICTFITRVIPFALFGGKREMPPFMKKLADILPLSMIALLVVYCLKDTVSLSISQNSVTFFACAVVCGLHLWKGNTLLSLSLIHI